MSIGELCAPTSPPGAASAIEAVEGGPSTADTNGVEALGGFSMKLGSVASTTGSADASGTAWTGEVGAGGGSNVGGGAWVEGGVDVGGGGGADGEEGATLFLLVTRPSSVASSSYSSSS